MEVTADERPPKRWRHYTQDEHDMMVRMWQDGASLDQIAKAIGRTRDSVIYRISAHRSDFPHHRPHSTEDERREMVELRSRGWTYMQIAKYLGVSDTTVRNHAHDGRRLSCAATRTTKTEG